MKGRTPIFTEPSLSHRISRATDKVRGGNVPPDPCDPDVVLFDCEVEIDRLAAEIARLSALVPSGGDQPLRCQVSNGAIIIYFGERILSTATAWLPNLYDSENDRPLYRVTDPALFAAAVAAEMNSEGDDGSTPLTRFIDSMIEETIEQGGNGFEENPPIPPLPGTEPG